MVCLRCGVPIVYNAAKMRLFGFLFILLASVVIVPAQAQAEPQKRVLVIYSYEPSFGMTKRIASHLHAAFDGKYKIEEEFLYTKKHDPEMMFELGAAALEGKLKAFGHPDIVLTFDDNAIIFADRYRERLFPRAPIVFGGVNSRERVLAMAGKPNTTGVFEELWLRDIVELAISLNPAPLRRIVAVHDDTRTSQAVLRGIRVHVDTIPNLTLETIDTSTMTFQQALDRVGAIEAADTAIFHSAAFRDISGATITNRVFAREFTARAQRPIYSYLDVAIENGATAGYVISTEGIAAASAGLAERILAGESADAVEAILESPNRLMIDEPNARRFSLRLDRLSEPAQFIRPIPSFWTRYSRALVAICAVLAAIAVLLAAILIANRRVKLGLMAMNQTLYAQNELLVEAKNRIEHQSLHDPLTGLSNRRHLEKTLAELAIERDQSKALALVQIDLDYFKQINDTLGHLAGDEIIRIAARLIEDVAPMDAFVARIGGDEYVVVNAFETIAAAEQFGSALATHLRRSVSVENMGTRLSASIGVACIAPYDKIDDRELLRRSDVALYLAKAGGRGRSAVFLPEHDVAYRRRKQLADDIVRGLEADEFEPYFQPQICAATGAVAGIEALVRWRHPERGLLAPASFLSVAESIDAVAKIDRLMLEKATRHLAEWREAGIRPPQLSVNVSAKRLLEPTLPDTVARLDFGDTALCFELVESIFLDNADAVLDHTIDKLQELGVRIEVDDFGTGHASILGVRRLKPHRLKIARELIAPLEQGGQHRQLAQAIVQIGRSLGIQLTAEGVETEGQARILREIGCDVFQGFLYSRPIAPEDTLEFLQARSAATVAA